MKEPDADGYVNIIWPSRTVPHGGIFHNRRADPTPAQREFLKVLIEEAKFTNAIRENKDYRLRREDETGRGPEPEECTPRVRPRTSKRRSLSAIREFGIYDDEPFKPLKRGEDREKLKDQLANTMAYGPEPDQKPPPPPRIAKPKPKLPTEKEKWHDLITQIRERADWLAEMEDLGQAEPHRDIIKHQIAERFRALDALGIDSECSSVKSGFSTTRSREIMVRTPTARSNGSAQSKGSAKSNKSNKCTDLSVKGEPIKSADSQSKPRQVKSSPSCGSKKKEENVASYSLKYSPRRRV